jgi:hypothetical protein
VPNLSLEETPKNINLLGYLLSVPENGYMLYFHKSDYKFWLARRCKWKIVFLWRSYSYILIDFLNSNLQTFRKDERIIIIGYQILRITKFTKSLIE